MKTEDHTERNLCVVCGKPMYLRFHHCDRWVEEVKAHRDNLLKQVNQLGADLRKYWGEVPKNKAG